MAHPTDIPDAPLVAMGADGARGGWAAACLYADALTREQATVWQTRLQLFENVDELAAFRQDAGGQAAVAIDIPIGLLDSIDWRICDIQARERLGGRRGSVFMPPARYMLAVADDYDAIRKLVERERETNPKAKGLSAQSAGIAPKVREVDDWVRAHRDSERWLWECHPELSFWALNGAAPLEMGKGSAAGVVARLQLAAGAFPDAAQRIADTTWDRRKVVLADWLDAYAALSTAVVCARGGQEELGYGARDGEDLPMRMAM